MLVKKVMVKLENVTKNFDEKKIIKGIDLEIYEGEFLTFLGPSGCGKTTLLRTISGLEEVSSGKVYIDDIDVTNMPPQKEMSIQYFKILLYLIICLCKKILNLV